MNSRKGSIQDLFYILFMILAIGFVLLISRTIWNEVQPSLTSKLSSNNALNVLNTVTGTFASFDYIFLMVGIGSGLGIVILAFMTDSHPVFAFMLLLFVAIAVMLSGPFSNIFSEFTDSSSLSTAAASYPLMVTFMQNYPLFIMAIGFLLLIALYGKARGGGTR